jgi:iron complex outermembrane receptor protein
MNSAALTMNVENTLNTMPPFYNNPRGVGFDPTNADLLGRYVSVELLKRW